MPPTKVNYGTVSEPQWAEAVLVGGGPSLSGYDLNQLRGRTVVAINDALLNCPWATAVISADIPWMHKRREDVESFAGEKYFVVANDESGAPVPGVIYLRKQYDTGLSCDPGAINVRGSSGYAALNLAFLKGAHRIILLGFDFCNNGHQHHWHSNGRPEHDWLMAQWAEEFAAAGRQLHQAHVAVTNASPISRIACFKKVGVEYILGGAHVLEL